MSSKKYKCPIDHYSVSIAELNANTGQLIANYKQTLGNRIKNDEENYEENKMDALRSKTFERLRKNDQTLNYDDLINLTTVKTFDEKIAFKRLRQACLKSVMKSAVLKYTKQPTNFRHLFEHDIFKTKHLKLLTISTNKASLYIENLVKQDNEIYQEQLKNFKKNKTLFKEFVDHARDQHNTIKDKMKIEANKVKIYGDELEECENIYACAKNEILKLFREITVLEACYLILMCLSPPQWRKEHNVQELKYDFMNTNGGTTQVSNYMDFAYQKPLAEFEKDLQSHLVFDMYWESAEQINKKLIQHEKKTRDTITVMDKIRESQEILNHRQQYGYVNVQKENKRRLKEKILLNKNRIKEIMSAYELRCQTLVQNETILKIKSMLLDIYSKLKNCPYGKYDSIDVEKVLTLLFTRLDEIRVVCEAMPTDIWRLTKKILDKNNDDEIKRQNILNPKISKHKINCNKPLAEIRLKILLNNKKAKAK
jgi:hypothetical protein